MFGFQEPTLLELLRDPLVRLLMTRDGVTDAMMCSLLGAIRSGRRAADGREGVVNRAAAAGRSRATVLSALCPQWGGSHGLLLAAAGSGQDQVGDLLWVGDQGKVARL
jgi:hypothetical protein